MEALEEKLSANDGGSYGGRIVRFSKSPEVLRNFIIEVFLKHGKKLDILLFVLAHGEEFTGDHRRDAVQALGQSFLGVAGTAREVGVVGPGLQSQETRRTLVAIQDALASDKKAEVRIAAAAALLTRPQLWTEETVSIVTQKLVEENTVEGWNAMTKCLLAWIEYQDGFFSPRSLLSSEGGAQTAVQTRTIFGGNCGPRGTFRRERTSLTRSLLHGVFTTVSHVLKTREITETKQNLLDSIRSKLENTADASAVENTLSFLKNHPRKSWWTEDEGLANALRGMIADEMSEDPQPLSQAVREAVLSVFCTRLFRVETSRDEDLAVLSQAIAADHSPDLQLRTVKVLGGAAEEHNMLPLWNGAILNAIKERKNSSATKDLKDAATKAVVAYRVYRLFVHNEGLDVGDQLATETNGDPEYRHLVVLACLEYLKAQQPPRTTFSEIPQLRQWLLQHAESATTAERRKEAVEKFGELLPLWDAEVFTFLTERGTADSDQDVRNAAINAVAARAAYRLGRLEINNSSPGRRDRKKPQELFETEQFLTAAGDESDARSTRRQFFTHWFRDYKGRPLANLRDAPTLRDFLIKDLKSTSSWRDRQNIAKLLGTGEALPLWDDEILAAMRGSASKDGDSDVRRAAEWSLTLHEFFFQGGFREEEGSLKKIVNSNESQRREVFQMWLDVAGVGR